MSLTCQSGDAYCIHKKEDRVSVKPGESSGSVELWQTPDSCDKTIEQPRTLRLTIESDCRHNCDHSLD